MSCVYVVEERDRGRGDSTVRPVCVVIMVDCEWWVFLLGNTGGQRRNLSKIIMGLNNFTQEQVKFNLRKWF